MDPKTSHRLYLTLRAVAIAWMFGAIAVSVATIISDQTDASRDQDELRRPGVPFVTNTGGVVVLSPDRRTEASRLGYIEATSAQVQAAIDDRKRMADGDSLVVVVVGLLCAFAPLAAVLGIRRWWLWLRSP